MLAREDVDTQALIGRIGKAKVSSGIHAKQLASMPIQELSALISSLTDQMHAAAAALQFELAARIRDEVAELKKELRGMQAAGI